MADVKWIKITTDIFDDEKILLIESLPESDSIIVIWFKLLCLAGKTNNSGVFLMNNSIAYTDEMLATIFRRKESTVKMALDTFEHFGMIERVDGVLTIPNWGKHQTLDRLEKKQEYQREYMRDYRAKQKKIADKSDCKTNCKTNSEANVSSLEEDIDIEEDKEKEIKKVADASPTPYSFDKNSNVANLLHVLKDSEPIDIELQNCLMDWMEYKDERKPRNVHHYVSQRSIKSLITQFVTHYNDYGIDAVKETVELSISNQWQGVAWDKLDRMPKKHEEIPQQVKEDRWQ